MSLSEKRGNGIRFQNIDSRAFVLCFLTGFRTREGQFAAHRRRDETTARPSTCLTSAGKTADTSSTGADGGENWRTL